MRVHGALGGFDATERRTLGAWILTIARRLCTDRARYRRRRPTVSHRRGAARRRDAGGRRASSTGRGRRGRCDRPLPRCRTSSARWWRCSCGTGSSTTRSRPSSGCRWGRCARDWRAPGMRSSGRWASTTRSEMEPIDDLIRGAMPRAPRGIADAVERRTGCATTRAAHARRRRRAGRRGGGAGPVDDCATVAGAARQHVGGDARRATRPRAVTRSASAGRSPSVRSSTSATSAGRRSSGRAPASVRAWSCARTRMCASRTARSNC